MGVLHKFEIERENLQNIVDILRVKHETEIKILEESHEYVQFDALELVKKKKNKGRY